MGSNLKRAPERGRASGPSLLSDCLELGRGNGHASKAVVVIRPEVNPGQLGRNHHVSEGPAPPTDLNRFRAGFLNGQGAGQGFLRHEDGKGLLAAGGPAVAVQE